MRDYPSAPIRKGTAFIVIIMIALPAVLFFSESEIDRH